MTPSELRPLDASHFATAQELGGDLGALVTCDDSTSRRQNTFARQARPTSL
jgi:hypothetical protein